MQGDFVDTYLKVPTNASAKAPKCAVTLFKYKDVIAVLRDAETFTSGLLPKEWGLLTD